MEILNEEMENCKMEKSQLERDIEEFSSEVNKRVDEWKVKQFLAA